LALALKTDMVVFEGTINQSVRIRSLHLPW